ncbi:PREDICTED: olfactory receptor 13A1-like [Chrysochloris asiatica]|uniref:Olfactory receptor 13A1-like n=1 Tax=Chrysochloris asiatica TaxID=185453 RepID=A0A9B0X0I3_CHRAS|nr:PREDICTED: olfactory receptor 13A1-like [Chrysochloris asiatica]
MSADNHTTVVEFILQGFSEDPHLQGLISILFLLLYLIALTGNGLIVIVVTLSPGLHTPMYFFLINLAILDIVCASTVLPKLLEILVVQGDIISYWGCLTQLFFLTWFLGAELLLLTAMAFDRYVAICQPLRYGTIMSWPVCALLAMAVWTISALNTSANTGLIAQLNFCGPNHIQHFMCEAPMLVLLSCSPTTLNNILIIMADVYFGVVNFLLTLVSYGYIVASILRIRSALGKRRAFSTCSSHLLVVTWYYSTVIYTYFLPGSGASMQNGKVGAVLYTAVSPALNPLIYTLRNKDVKAALQKVAPVSWCDHSSPNSWNQKGSGNLDSLVPGTCLVDAAVPSVLGLVNGWEAQGCVAITLSPPQDPYLVTPVRNAEDSTTFLRVLPLGVIITLRMGCLYLDFDLSPPSTQVALFLLDMRTL